MNTINQIDFASLTAVVNAIYNCNKGFEDACEVGDREAGGVHLGNLNRICEIIGGMPLCNKLALVVPLMEGGDRMDMHGVSSITGLSVPGVRFQVQKMERLAS